METSLVDVEQKIAGVQTAAPVVLWTNSRAETFAAGLKHPTLEKKIPPSELAIRLFWKPLRSPLSITGFIVELFFQKVNRLSGKNC